MIVRQKTCLFVPCENLILIKESAIKQNILIYRELGIDSRQEHVVFMREDCHVCISEGFEALTRIRVSSNGKSVVATLNVLHSDILKKGEIGLSERASRFLGIRQGDVLRVSHLAPFDSMSHVRAKIYGKKLGKTEIKDVIEDIVEGNYSVAQLASFVTACAGNRLDIDEITNLTTAMIDAGDRLQWNGGVVVDKHCIGGLPGNRTTPVVVSIITSFGLKMPKTSSRAITSPAGTADTMEVITNINLTTDRMREVVQTCGGVIAWGGASNLSPADDMLIRVEKAIDVDSEGQMIASVLSKKVAAGSTHVVIDFPVGETAKLRSKEAALHLKKQMEEVAKRIGIKIRIVLTDGSQPVGQGIGPALEAMDVLAVLRNDKKAPLDLKDRSILLAGEILELSGKVDKGGGVATATAILESGDAYSKFHQICLAQGRFSEPVYADYKKDIISDRSGIVSAIDNRRLGRIAKLAGAPGNPSSGVKFHSPLGKKVAAGDVLFTVYAESSGELEYALEYLELNPGIITIN